MREEKEKPYLLITAAAQTSNHQRKAHILTHVPCVSVGAVLPCALLTVLCHNLRSYSPSPPEGCASCAHQERAADSAPVTRSDPLWSQQQRVSGGWLDQCLHTYASLGLLSAALIGCVLGIQKHQCGISGPRAENEKSGLFSSHISVFWSGKLRFALISTRTKNSASTRCLLCTCSVRYKRDLASFHITLRHCGVAVVCRCSLSVHLLPRVRVQCARLAGRGRHRAP